MVFSAVSLASRKRRSWRASQTRNDLCRTHGGKCEIKKKERGVENEKGGDNKGQFSKRKINRNNIIVISIFSSLKKIEIFLNYKCDKCDF